MFRQMQLAIVSVLTLAAGFAQTAARPAFFSHARIERSGSRVTVTSNDSEPLLQAIAALRLEYGWQVDWEQAPGYSRFDVVDDTSPAWRTTHPNDPGVTRPSGGSFVASFSEPGPNGEHLALYELVEQYNATGNPGKYSFRTTEDGRIEIVGTQVLDDVGRPQDVRPILDTPITVESAERTVYDSIKSVLAALESATGKKLIFGVASESLFLNTRVTVGGTNAAARRLLERALAGTGRQLNYDLGFNPDVPVYVLNVSPVGRLSSRAAP